MTHPDQRTENEIVAKGLTAPRVTLADIQENVVDVEIHKHVTKSGQVLRWAILTTRCGFAVVGNPSCSVSSENDNAEIGERVALDNSRSALWPLMGYELSARLHAEARQAAAAPATTFQDRVRAERAELADRLQKLQAFIMSPVYDALKQDEKNRLKHQSEAMDFYLEILGERVAAFDESASAG